MNKLIELGLTDLDIINIVEQTPNIKLISDEEINNKIDILTYTGCNLRHIKHIIISNPDYLTKEEEEILKLIKYLKEIGFNNLYLLFDSNPLLLTKDREEIKEYLDNKLNNGMSLEDIIDEFDNNPYIIEE